jgi:hypothetical protein
MLLKTLLNTGYIILMAGILSCTSSTLRDIPDSVTGYKPVYASGNQDLKQVYAKSEQPTVKAGKIYVTGNLLFQVEQDSGIHVINIADRAHPEKIGFIKSAMCREVAVKNGYVYTNNLADLVVVDISDINNVQVKSRIENVFPDLMLQSPPAFANGQLTYFECPDPAKGVIIGWQQTTVNKPKCWK